MKNKKIIMYVSVVLIVVILIGVGYIIYNKLKNKNTKPENISEIIPQAEITEEQLRQTVVNLYFLDAKTLTLKTETRKIDSKELINNPYEKLINLLMQGPKDETLLKLIPENTKLNSVKIQDNILYIDFSEDFIKEQSLGKEQEEIILKSIVNTVTELNEVNKVAFLIDGKADKGFPDEGVIFNKIFVRE